MHAIPTKPPGGSGWTWNGSLDKPTIDPSISISAGHYAKSWQLGDECWCGKGYGFECYRCHSMITDGRIMFCSDSSHALSGQTVDLPELDDAVILPVSPSQ